MESYAIYIIPAYAVTAVLLLLVAGISAWQYRRTRRQLAELQGGDDA